MKQIILNRVGDRGDSYLESLLTRPNSTLAFDSQGRLSVVPLYGSSETFELLPATSVAAGTSKLVLLSGTGTELTARAAKGGANIKTQATTPADGDTVILAGVATTGFTVPIKPLSQAVFETRVAIGTTAFATMFASFGLDENITDIDPSGTAGEGAKFLYDPTREVTATGFSAAQHLNWILAHKTDQAPGTDSFTATSIPVVADTDYELRIEVDANLTANYYIDNVLVGQGPALTDGDSFHVLVGAELTATPAGQADVDIRYLRVSRGLG